MLRYIRITYKKAVTYIRGGLRHTWNDVCDVEMSFYDRKQ